MFDLTRSKDEEEIARAESYYMPSSSTSSYEPISPGPRISLLPTLDSSVNTSSKVKFFPAHNSSASSQEPLLKNSELKQWEPSVLDRIGSFFSGIGKAFNSGGENSPVVTGLTKAFLGDQYNATSAPEPYKPQNIAESLASMAGEQAVEWPLWTLGDAALAKPLGALAKSVPVVRVADAMPDIVRPALRTIEPALGTGIKAGATYGGVIAPFDAAVKTYTDNQTQPDFFKNLVEEEKQTPEIALGGALLHGAGQLVGKGINDLRNSNADLRLGDLTQPLDEAVQNAYKVPTLQDYQQANPITHSLQRSIDLGPLKLSDTLTPEYKAKQAELNDVFSKAPIGSPETLNPLSKSTLQQNIDNSLGIGKQAEPYQGLSAFGKPLQSFKINNDIQNAIDEIQAQMDNQVNGIANSLKQMDGQTKIESIRNRVKNLGGISQGNNNIFEEQKVIPNWIRNNTTGRPLDEVADTLGMNSDELLRAISDSAYKPKDYVTEAYRIASHDPEYQKLSDTLDYLQAELPGKRRLGPITSYSDNPEIINQKQWYHGTGVEGLEGNTLSPNQTKIEGLFGQGVYLTDNPEIAKGYADARSKRTNTPTVYGANVNVGKVLDLEKPLDGNAYSILRNTANQISTNYDYPDLVRNMDGLYKKGATGDEIWRTMSNGISDLSRELMIPKSEFDDYFGDITANLKENGYDAFTHVGGKRTDNKPHQVLIMLDPNDHLANTGRVGQVTKFDPTTEFPKVLTKADIKLKPRELTPKFEPQPLQPQQPPRLTLSGNLPPIEEPLSKPTKVLQPIQKEPLTWTNREGLPIQDTPARSIPEQQTLGDILKSQKVEQTPPKDNNKFWLNVNKELYSKGEQPPFNFEQMKMNIRDGKLNIDGLSNEEDIRKMLGMDIQKFSNGKAAEIEASNPVDTYLPGGELPEPQSKIIIGKQKEGTSFKDALNKFYTATVNSQQPIVNAGKVAESDIGKLASNTKNVSGIVYYNFLKGMVDKNGDKVGKPLKDVIGAIPKGQEENFWTYMTQRHNIDRAREGKPVQANYTPEMSADAVQRIEQEHPEYKQIGNNIVNWIDKFMRTWGVDTGIVDRDVYEGLRQTYKSYIPTQREFSELEKAIPDNVSQKFADQRNPIRKATGSERDIKDPTENIMQLVNRTIRTAKYNEVGQSLLDSVRQAPLKMSPLAEEISTKEGMFANTDNVISVLEDGKPTYLKINDKSLLDAMNGLPKAIGNIPVISKLTNGFKSLITQKNPIFAIRNIFRDIPTAYVNGSTTNPLKFGADLIGAGKDILTNSPRFQKYQAVGGGGANFFNSGDVTKSAAELKGRGNGIKKALSAPIKGIEKFNNMIEAAPRLAEFNRVLDKTGDVAKALYAANDVTVNFSRGGNLTKSADRIVPYLNAGVQGLDRFVRSFIDPKTAIKTIVKSGISITTPTLALYMINKDNPDYQALDNRTKDNYYLFPNDDGTFTKIPKSRELGVLFSSLFERVLRANEGEENAFKGFGNTVATNFAPANPIDSNFFAPATWNIATNKDFANRAIVPQSMLMDKRSPYLQYDDKTSEPAKWFADLIKDAPIPDKIKEVIGSPKRLDYLVKSYSGVIGQLGLPLATSGGDSTKAITSQFTADPAFSNQITTDFYDKLDQLSTFATDKNITEGIESKKLTPEEDMRNSMNGVSSALSRGTKLINSIQAGDDTDKDDQIKYIKSQMLSLIAKAVHANDPSSMQSVEDEAKSMWKK